jgi:hypothetical protein
MWIAVIVLFPPERLSAGPLEERVRRTSIYGKAENLEMEIRMVIENDGKETERTLKAFISREGEESKILLQIISPAYLNRMKYLSIRDSAGRESRWLKTSQVVRRLSERNYGDSLFGSDFTVEDLSEFPVDGYRYTDKGEARVEGRSVTVIEAVPLENGGNYSRRVLYLDDASDLLMKAEFYDAAGSAVKVYSVLETRVLGKELCPGSCIMKSVGENSRTSLQFMSIEVKESLPDRYFNKGSL